MKRLLFAVLLYACGSLAAETSRSQTGTETQSAGQPVENPGVGTERADCADWNTEKFFKSAVPEDISSCLSEGTDPNAKGDYGDTPLHLAAEHHGNAAVTQALIAADADPRARTNSGQTPLHSARYATAAEALLAAGADWKERDENGLTPLHTAAAADLSGPSNQPRTSLDEQLIGVLVDAGSDPDVREASGRTPLHLFALGVWVFWDAPELHDAIVKPLIAGGADPDALDQDRNTPLHLAAASRNYKSENVVMALLDAGANAMLTNAHDQTP